MYGNPVGVGTGLQPKAWLETVKNYIEVTKPRSVFLLVFTALVAMFLAAAEYGITVPVFIKSLLAITFSCSGVNAVSCYVDRDIDAVMERTRHRPIPSGRIAPPVKALIWGLAQFFVALVIAWTLNPASFVCIFLGMLGYVGIYSLWFKRKSAWNIILGGFSGGLPVLFGWTALAAKVELLPLLLSLLVVLWIPNHIWNLAIFYKDDYRKVGVPMLPVVINTRRALIYIMVTVLAMFALSLGIYYAGNLGYVYLVTAVVCGMAVAAGNLYLFFVPEQRGAWFLYKLSRPYLFLLFLALVIDRYF